VYLKETIKSIWRFKVEGTDKELSTIFAENLHLIAEEKQKEINQEVLPRIELRSFFLMFRKSLSTLSTNLLISQKPSM
jgi:hypothetical protein